MRTLKSLLLILFWPYQIYKSLKGFIEKSRGEFLCLVFLLVFSVVFLVFSLIFSGYALFTPIRVPESYLAWVVYGLLFVFYKAAFTKEGNFR